MNPLSILLIGQTLVSFPSAAAEAVINSDPHEGFSVICLLFFSLTSSFTSTVLSREASYFRSVFGVGFFVVVDDDNFLKIFMVSFFTPYFLFDYIKKKYIFALHETFESLITVF